MVFTKWIGPGGLTGSFPLGDRCLNNLLGLFIFTGEAGGLMTVADLTSST